MRSRVLATCLLLARVRCGGEPASFWKVQPASTGPLGLEYRHCGDELSRVLPPDVRVSSIDTRSPRALRELSRFLTEHYQGEESFRVQQPAARLRWVLNPPGMRDSWAVGLRLGGELVAFAAALPVALAVDGARVDAVEVTYLCVHAAQRGKRLTRVLLRALARRVADAGVQHAVYTTSNERLPRALGRAHFYHRPLRPRRLIASGFVEVEPLFEALYAERFAVPRRTRTRGLRPLRPCDLPAARALVNRAHGRARLGRVVGSDAELGHLALPQRGLVAAYVLPCARTGRARALLTFALSVAHPHEAGDARRSAWRRLLARRRPPIRAATLQLLAADMGVDIEQLLADGLVLARRHGCDVLTALDTFEAGPLLSPLRFAESEGSLSFHLYNYGVAHGRGERAPSLRARHAASAISSGVRARAVGARLSCALDRGRLPALGLLLRPEEIALPSSL